MWGKLTISARALPDDAPRIIRQLRDPHECDSVSTRLSKHELFTVIVGEEWYIIRDH